KAVAMRLDVSSEESVKTTIEKIKSEYGSLDILVNNAGIDFTKSIMELSVSEWDAAFSVNLRGPFLMSKYAMEVMSPQKSGNIINIVSTASLRAWTEASVYHASKWGLRGFSHALFTEARKVNVKVTAIIAGGMSTPFLLDRFPDIPPQNLQDPKNVATKIRYIIEDDTDTVVPEILILPLMETSWP
ncbi:MAG: SDR family oxidoreductase, partial [Janthinobacterium lividum]